MKALVTGGCSGLGLYFTKSLLNRGYQVIALYHTSENKAHELESKYPNLKCIKCDIRDEDKVAVIFADIKKVDIIINNAALAVDNDYRDKSYQEFMDVLSVNVGGAFNVIKHGSKYMSDGIIINISSDNTLGNNSPLSMDYDASKAGLNMLTIDFSEALDNIKVIAYAPGWIKTQAVEEMNPIYLREQLVKNKQDKLLDPYLLVEFILDDYKIHDSGSIIPIKEV